MGFRCIVSSCRARYKKESSLSFYQLPKDEKMKEQWFSILEISNLKFTSVARICSRHFTDESFIPRHFGRGRSLRADAVPTLYIGDNNDNRVIRTKKKFTSPNIISARRQSNIVPVCKQINDCDENEIHSDAEDNPSTISESELLENDSRHAEGLTSNTVIISDISLKNLPRRRRYFEGDFSIEDMDSPKTARFYFQQARSRISQLQTQIQMLKKRNKQLNDKNLKLLVIIEKLKPNDENLSDKKSEQNNSDISAPVKEEICEKLTNIKQDTEIFRYVASIPDDNESTSLPVNDNEQENMNKIFRYVAANSIDIDKSSCSVEQEAKNVIYRYIFSDSDHDYCT